MHWPRCNLLAIILCATYVKDSGRIMQFDWEFEAETRFYLKKNSCNYGWTFMYSSIFGSHKKYPQFSVAQTELPNKSAETLVTVHPKENEVNYQFKNSTESTATEEIISNSTDNLIQEFQDKMNLTLEKADDIISSNAISLKSDQKRDVENITFNDIKPFLLFPILPFLFPPKENESLNPDKNEFSISKKKTSKMDGNPAKPFIFFDFSIIHRIPLINSTGSLNDSKIINVMKLSESEELKNSHKNRKRRNASEKMDTNGFFDHSPLFPNSELEEFLPRSDLFFPDLPFHHRPFKKLIRRKRDQKKTDFKNDLKFFFDAFDNAFMRTKRELERVDPILNSLKRGEQPFDEEKKEEDDFFSLFPIIQEKPRVKWKIQRNIKRLNNNHQDRVENGQDSPMILVDKVVKIGEFQMYDEGEDKDKLKKKEKRRMNDSKKNSKEDESKTNDNDEAFSNKIFELMKKEENGRKKRNHSVDINELSHTKTQSKEIRVLPQMNTSFLSLGSNTKTEVKKKGAEIESQKANATEKEFKYGNFMKVIDSLKTKIKEELTNSAEPTKTRLKRKGSSNYGELDSKKASYDNLKKNISELLNQFLELAKNLDDAKLVERLEVSKRKNAEVLDWTEKDASQSHSNMLGKYSREKRQKKNADFEDEYIDLGKKERQIAELNYLFLTVTLPTVFIFALALFVCFFSLQVKGKICPRLFRQSQIFITEDENPAQLKCSTKIKTPSKAQAI